MPGSAAGLPRPARLRLAPEEAPADKRRFPRGRPSEPLGSPAPAEMPRGFLVKRSRRGCCRPRPAAPSEAPRRAPEEEEERGPAGSPRPGSPPAAASASGLPLRPPRSPESFPAPPPPPPPPRRPPPRPKRPKAGGAARRLSFADEVTTSPVLGLRITAAAAASEGAEGGRGSSPASLPGGQFVCQLCKEPYGAPLALAQHRCSRIVRVEYRCPECHKAFSCPANLASHRRWHKPRPSPAPPPAAQGKENGAQQRPQTPTGAPDAARCKDPDAASSAASSSVGELFLCPFCRKTFRRQAYLRKHLGTHQPGPPTPAPPPPSFPCAFCGAPFPSADLRDKHRLWHAVLPEELLLSRAALPVQPQPPPPPPPPPQQILSCKHCPATFFSAPGLTRHTTKCHPSENRQLLLLQMPLRPGC